MKKSILCLTASQRAGTTSLQSALGATGIFHNMKEIFHTNERDFSDGSFLKFAKNENISIIDMCRHDGALSVYDKYINFLFKKSVNKVPLVDIKFNSWMAINPFWSYFNEIPFFMRSLKDRGAFFIIIIRKDVSSQIISEEIARKIDKWHSINQSDVREKFSIDVAHFKSRLKMIVESEKIMVDHLLSLGEFSAIFYENLFINGMVNESLVKKISDEFGVDVSGVACDGIKKNKANKMNIITNYDDLLDVSCDFVSRVGRVSIESLDSYIG